MLEKHAANLGFVSQNGYSQYLVNRTSGFCQHGKHASCGVLPGWYDPISNLPPSQGIGMAHFLQTVLVVVVFVPLLRPRNPSRAAKTVVMTKRALERVPRSALIPSHGHAMLSLSSLHIAVFLDGSHHDVQHIRTTRKPRTPPPPPPVYSMF